MAIVLADNTPRIEYTVAQGVTQTVFPIPFVFFNKEDSSNVDVKVFVDGVERTLGSISTTTFSITSGGNGAKGSLSTTVTGISGGSTVIVLRDTKIGRATDFPDGGAFEIQKLNRELDTLVAIEGDFEDHVSRSIRLQDKDTAVNLALPLKADRLGKQLGFNATTGAVEMLTAQTLSISSDSGTGTVDFTANTLAFTSGEGINTSISNQTVTIEGELATTSNKGIASFSSTFFDVSSGEVTFKAAQTGITSLLATDIKIGEDDETKIDFETADTINFYANNRNVLRLEEANGGDVILTAPVSNQNFTIKGVDNGSTITALDIDMAQAGKATFNSDVVITGQLTINGSVTTIDTANLVVEDSLISLAKNNGDGNNLDIGFYGLYDVGGTDKYAGLFRDANDNGKFKLFKDVESEPTTVVDTTATGYAVGTLVANFEGDITGDVTGNLTGRFFGNNASSINGDFTFFGTNGNIVFDKSDDALEFADNVKAKFGTGDDLQIYHDGNDSYIQETGTGNLNVRSSSFRVRTADNSAFLLRADTGGFTRLYYNGNHKLTTQDTGVDIVGTLTANGISLGDTEEIKLGNSDDLKIKHNGNNSFISDSGTGALLLTTNHFKVVNPAMNENMINALEDLQVELYYNGNKRFETTSSGVTVTGTLKSGAMRVAGTGGANDNELLLIQNTDTGSSSIAGLNMIRTTTADANYGDSLVPSFSLAIKNDDCLHIINGTQTLMKFGDSSNDVILGGSSQDILFQGQSNSKFMRWRSGQNELLFADQTYASFGNSGDMALYHQSGTNIIYSNNLLSLDSNTTQFRNTSQNATFASIDTVGLNLTAGKVITFEGATNDDFETTLTVEDPTADRTLTLPNKTGTIATLADITSSGNDFTNDVTITSTDADADADPSLILYRNSASPATNDILGEIFFRGRNDNSQDVEYGHIRVDLANVSDGTEHGRMDFSVMRNGALTQFMAFNGGAAQTYSNFPLNMQRNHIYAVNTVVFEGSTNDDNETTLTVTDPTTDRTINFPNASGDVVLNESGTVNISSTDAGASDGPIVNLFRNSASPTVNDQIGEVRFLGKNDAGQDVEYGSISSSLIDATDGSEDSRTEIRGMVNGVNTIYYQAKFGLNSFNTTVKLSPNIDIVYEGATDNANETTLTVVDPTADRTITFPDASGTVFTSGNPNDITDIGIQQYSIQLGTNADLIFEGATANAHETTLTVTDPTADRTITLPDATGTVLVNTSDSVTITDTGDGNAAGPNLILFRDSSSPADFDNIGQIFFRAKNDGTHGNSTTTDYARISAQAVDVSDLSQDAYLRFFTKVGATDQEHFRIGFSTTDFFGRVRLSGNAVFSNPVIIFEGSTADSHETTLAVTDPTSDRTVTFPDATGTVLTTGNSDTPTTTTSSSDADFVLIDDGGTMKKITPSNLGIGTGGGGTAADDITAGDSAVNITTTSGNITIDAQGSDTDIIFKGTDGGSDRTFLTFDGSTNTADFTQDSTAVEVANGQLFVMNGSNYARFFYQASTNVGLTLPTRSAALSLYPAFIQVYLSSNSSALTTSYVTIVFDEVPEQDTISLDGVIYNTSNGEFSFTRAMTLQIQADITTDVTSGSNRSDTQSRLEKQPSGGSFSQVPGTEAHAYNRNSSRGEQTMSINMIVTVAATDKLRFTCKQAGGTDTVVIRGDATRANMIEIT